MDRFLNTHSLTRWIPLVFVLLWSTGFIGAKAALPFVEPFNLLFIRMLITLIVFAGLIHLFRSRWPSFSQALHQMVVGSLVHAAYLGGVFPAIKWQMPAGIASLLVGLQPLLTAVLAFAVFSERLRASQWAGLFLGLAGVSMVMLRGGGLGGIDITLSAFIATMIALIGISVGTLYQKRFGAGTDLISGSFFQYLATAGWMGLLAFLYEEQTIIWHPQLIAALAWLVFGLSVTAILLLMYMIREGEAAKVASYFYLVPPVTAIEAWWLFGESLNSIAIAGMVVAVLGVYMVIHSQTSKDPNV